MHSRGAIAALCGVAAAISFGAASASAATVYSENFDGVAPPGLPAGWGGGFEGAPTKWTTTAAAPISAPSSLFIAEATTAEQNFVFSAPIKLPRR